MAIFGPQGPFFRSAKKTFRKHNFLCLSRASFWALICPDTSMYVVRVRKNPNFGPKTSCFCPKWLFLVVQKFSKVVRSIGLIFHREIIFLAHFCENHTLNTLKNRFGASKKIFIISIVFIAPKISGNTYLTRFFGFFIEKLYFRHFPQMVKWYLTEEGPIQS